MPKKDQGVSLNRFQVIPRTLIFITRGNEILFLKGAPTKKIWANRLNGLGGHIERGEDVLTAARRELLEESGLILERLFLCGTIIVDAGESTGICIFVFRGEYESGEVITSAEGELVWMKYPECLESDLVEDLPFILPQVFVRHEGDSPFYARYRYDDTEKLIIAFGG